MSRRKILARGFLPLLSSFSKRNAISFWHLDKKIICHSVPFWNTAFLRDRSYKLFKSNFLNSGWTTSQSSAVQLSSSLDEKCWKCNELVKRKKFSCPSCGALQHPKKNVNYFELFGISETFNMNLEDLSTKYKNMQMMFHPDKFVNKSKTEMEISEIYTRLLNKAYTTLKEPLKRGLYLLELRKLPSPEENFPIEQTFLTSIMEKNEELESINNEVALEKFMKNNNEEINKQLILISDCFNGSNWKDAKVNLMKLNYFLTLDSRVKGKQTNLKSPEQN